MPRSRCRRLSSRIGRRVAPVLFGFALTALPVFASVGEAAEVSASAHATKGPLKIIVSLNKQRMYVYRGQERLLTSRVSTGKRGHSTPAGVFSILEKRKWHRSNIYSGAPMPYMQRLTWSGIALHAGHVPNYPASHGCIRLPKRFARRLFQETKVGAHVIVTRDETEPQPIEHRNLLQPRPLHLVTMDAQTALQQRLSFNRRAPFYIALPERANRGKRYAALAAKDGDITANDASPMPSEPAMTAREAALHMANVEYDADELNSYVRRSKDPLRILITWRKGRERIRETQRLLKQLGYDPGDIDGIMGRQTGSAIREFQKAWGMRATGAFSEKLLQTLYDAADEEPAPLGHIYVRQGFKSVFDAPVTLTDPNKPLGTHIYFALDFDTNATHTDWLALTSAKAPEGNAVTALDRIKLPESVRRRLERALTPGSSIIISDSGLGRETGKGTDFVVLTH